MKTKNFVSLLLAALLMQSCSAQINLNKIKKDAEEILNNQNSGSLTEDEIIQGLKEALKVGSENAGTLASKADGFYKNPKIFIPFPPEVQNVADKLKELGLQKQADEFVMTLNRAAEEACKKAAPIFVDAVMKMTIKDARNILSGNDTAATHYLRTNTSQQLFTAFKPDVETALNSVGATKHWDDIANIYNKLPFVQKVNPDLPAYTTNLAIKGLFLLVGEEETKIRKDPAARVTDILKNVFGSK